MKEQGTGNSISVEGWKRHIIEFASKCEFGTPEFQALSDFYQLADLCEDTKSEELSQFAIGGHLTHLPHEKRLEVIMQRIVMLEHTIDQKKSNIPGYANAFSELSISFHELENATSDAAEINFTNDPAQQTAYVNRIYLEVLESIAEDIFAVHTRD